MGERTEDLRRIAIYRKGESMKNWPYAQLTSQAKQMGGPERMVEIIKSASRAEGRRDMVPWVGAAAVGGFCLKLVYDKVRNYLEARKEIHRKNARQAEKMLVQTMREEGANENNPAANNE